MHPETPLDDNERGNGAPIVCVGEALVDLISNPADHWSEIEQFIPRIGGAPANTAVAIRRLGGRSAFLGCLADDPPGQWIYQRLVAERVDVSRAVITSVPQTRLAAVTGPINRRDFDFYGSPAADSLLTPEHIVEARLDEAAAIMAGSLLLLSEPGRTAMYRVLEIAASNGIPITFDPNPRPKTWPDPQRTRDLLIPFIQHASILKLGVDEPAILGMTVEQIRAEQPEEAVFVLTDGENGCWYWYGEGHPTAVPPFEVQAVDSTGAGDAFSAALTLRRVQNGGTIEFEDIRFASAVGALTTTREGAMDALPDHGRVRQLLDRFESSRPDSLPGE